MKQVTQNLSDGVIRVVEVPEPVLQPHSVLVRTARSLVSVGTERTKVELGRSSLLEKARRRPEDVKKVLDRVRRDGLLDTYKMVKGRLDQASPLGYSAAGVVVAAGELVEGIRPGDRVACAGAGYANHAEMIAVPGNLCARIPEGVGFDSATYATVGAIAMQGVRQSEARFGDTVLVIGLGLVGLLTVQICKAAGLVVVGYDLDPAKATLAADCGADAVVIGEEDALSQVGAHSDGRGADAVLITASTRSDDPVRLAGEAARDRGTIVVVGDVGMDVPRPSFYHKELNLKLSRSYGPGRYDPLYEEFGIDYPVGYVKWTERRNLEEFLRLVSRGAVQTELLTTDTFRVDDAPAAYERIVNPGTESVIGVVLSYGSDDEEAPGATTRQAKPRPREAEGLVGVGLIGAGNFATSTLLPALTATRAVELRGIVTASGLSAGDSAARLGFAYAANTAEELVADADVDAVVIATRHDSHAPLVTLALSADKNVFVEKPLALSRVELEAVVDAWRTSSATVMVGFNRRYSPAARKIRSRVLELGTPPVIQIRVNAGSIPADHWIQRLEEGGGRIIGELCHFMDLACFLGGGRPLSVSAVGLGNGKSAAGQDSLVALVSMSTGAIASITYAAEGDTALPKERCEVFCGGSAFSVNDFRTLTTVSGGKASKDDYGKVDKGHGAELVEFVRLAQGELDPLGVFSSAVASTEATFCVVEALASGSVITVRDWGVEA